MTDISTFDFKALLKAIKGVRRKYCTSDLRDYLEDRGLEQHYDQIVEVLDGLGIKNHQTTNYEKDFLRTVLNDDRSH